MYLLIADAHETQLSKTADEFKAMLDAISRTQLNVVFLGDIMDLWIAMTRYEDELQKYFTQWCSAESKRRQVIFTEGNHEFFIADRRHSNFTIAEKNVCHMDKMLFAHGDKVQEGCLGFNRVFLGICKSFFGRAVLALMPWGPAFAAKVKNAMGSNGRIYKIKVPVDKIKAWAEKMHKKTGAMDIFLGHFHDGAEIPLSHGAVCHVLQAWKNEHNVALFDPESRKFQFKHWQECLTQF